MVVSEVGKKNTSPQLGVSRNRRSDAEIAWLAVRRSFLVEVGGLTRSVSACYRTAAVRGSASWDASRRPARVLFPVNRRNQYRPVVNQRMNGASLGRGPCPIGL